MATRQVPTSLVRDEEIYRVLGQLIAVRRKGHGLTQNELADKVHMSRASIANIERGRQKVLVHQLYRFAEALKVPEVGDLLPLTVVPNRQNADFLGVTFSNENISETNKALMSDLVSKALSQRKVKP